MLVHTGRLRHFSSLLYPEWQLWKNVISMAQEERILLEIQPVLDNLEWNMDHFDQVIFNYRETTLSDLNIFPHLSEFVETQIKPKFVSSGKALLPIHLLELNEGGYIKPHIDNLEASGSMIAGLSLNSDCTMRFASSKSRDSRTERIPQRSLYLQRYRVARPLHV